MRIIHITQFFHPTRGYQENHLSIIQAKEGHIVTIICSNDLELWGVNELLMNKLDEEFKEKYNVNIIRLRKIFKFSDRLFVLGLKRSIDKSLPDLLIIHGVSLPMSLYALKWGSKNNIKMIVDDHMVAAGSFNKFAYLFYIFFNKVFPLYLNLYKIKVDKWIAVSRETKNFMIVNYGIKDKIVTVPLGFDNNTVFKDVEGGKKWLQSHKIKDNLDTVLYIGKFDEIKKPIDILEGFNIFQEEYINFRLLLVGDPSKEYLAKLKKKISKLKLDNKIKLLPSLPNNQIRFAFSISKMCIWPHGSSMAMLEAMNCECPVIAPNIEVNRERLANERGMMFEENNTLDLVKMMKMTLKNEDDIIVKAKKWVNNYAWNKLSNEFYL